MSRQPVLGRERELAAVEAFLAREPARVSGLTLEGPAGIGKTTLWAAGIAAAEDRGWRVLSCRASPEELELGFGGLADLLGDVDVTAIVELSSVKRAALERALLTSGASDEGAIDARAVYAAVADVLRALAAHGPLLVAIDDWRWLDLETAAALAYAARRLGATDVRFLVTERSHAEFPERHALCDTLELERLGLVALGDETITLILQSRLRLSLPRRLTRRLYELASGNPLYALELSRAIARQAPRTDGAGEVFELPERLRSVVISRIRSLGPDARHALLAVALGGGLTATELSELVGEDAIEEALELEVLILDGPRVRLVHPLFGEVVRQQSRPSERRELHVAIAGRTDNDERRALHLAEAASGPDAELARVVAAAAATAAGRAAVSTAVELADRALRLTPVSDPARPERLLQLADYAMRAGQLMRAADVLRPVITEWPPGPSRGHARFLFTDAVASDIEAGLRAALAEVPAPCALRARILASLSVHIACGACERLAEAEAAAAESVAIAAAHSLPDQRVVAMSALAWVRTMRGLPIDDLAPDTDGIRSDVPAHQSLARIRAVAAMWRGELDAARDQLTAMLALADDRGEGDSYFVFRVQLCELELRAGRLASLADRLREWAQARGESQGDGAALLRFRASLAAVRGDADALELAQEAVGTAGPRLSWHRLESRRALGLAALAQGDVQTACVHLGDVWAHTRTQGIDNPGAFPVAADLTEALALRGAVEEARVVAQELARLAEAQDHPWAGAAAALAAGHVALADGQDAAAATAFADAGERFGALHHRLEQGRALLALGIAERRLRRRRQARASLDAAASLLSDLGAVIWARRAQAELARIGGRTSSGSALTSTEERIAELVARGMANKEVAAALVITVGAVEAHLTRIYAKLEIRSRTDLARHVLEG